MILEMLAADELLPEDPKALRATGYLVRNFKLLSRETWMQDCVEHTFMAFQGVTIGCAKCHDHMFDPILQTDYYRVRALFEPYNVRTDRLPGEPDTKKDGLVRVYDADLNAQTLFYLRGDDRTPDRNRKIVPGVPEVLGGTFKVETVQLPRAAYVTDKRPVVTPKMQEAAREAVARAQTGLRGVYQKGAARLTACLLDDLPLQRAVRLWAALQPLKDKAELAALDVQVAEARQEALIRLLTALRIERLEEACNLPDGYGWKDCAIKAGRAQRQSVALEARRAAVAARQAVSAADAKARPLAAKQAAGAEQALAKAEAALKLPDAPAYQRGKVPTYPPTSTGRRLALARWLADKENPLTARVAVNHVWLRHFGQAIVPSVFDFGRNGRPPSHPALLDWLTAEFMDRNWSMKALHRLIVTSSAYRMASTPDTASLAIDRDNKWLWRFAPRRVEAEVVRDSLLYVGGRLDLTMGGPDINHMEGLTSPRRSLYFRHAAEKQMEFLQLFDAAAVSECYERKHSIIPQQALALANSELARQQGRLLTRALAAKVGPDGTAFVTAAFEQVLTRSPTPTELAECTTFLSERTEHYRKAKLPAVSGNAADGRMPSSDPALRAREGLVHVLLNHHEFVTLR
jgi:hypothetical protein